MKKILVVLTFCLILTSLFSNDVLKFKQKIGSSYNLYWTHNEKNWSTQITYTSGNRPSLLLGASPLYVFEKGQLKVKMANYLGLKLDISNPHWPLKEIVNDSFLIPSMNKWLLYLRLATKIDKDKNLSFWGREFLGYQISEPCNLRLQTEWSYKEQEWTSFLGPALEYGITDSSSLGVYLSANTKNPEKKFGWLEIKKKFK